MEDKILTITIPSYNVEAYLEDCLESFVNSEVMDDIEAVSYTHLDVYKRQYQDW